MKSDLFVDQRPWSSEAAATLLDMSGKMPGFEAIGNQQLNAAVALHRMLLAQGSAYLADEVGMGKTYVALAVVALFRHLQPGFRVLYLAPSQNVLRKWHARELPAFIRNNVRQPDMRVQGPAGLSPAASTACLRVDEWLQGAVTDPSALDVFLPFSALSFPLNGDAPDNWFKRVKALANQAGVSVNLTGVRDKKTFKDRAAEVLNRAIPYYDLVVIDEAHLLKGGAGASASDRARFLARALGACSHGGTRRFGAALLMSGTPFDRDLLQLARQFELFAMPELGHAPHEHIEMLAEQRRAGSNWNEIQAGLKPYMIRRVQKLQVGEDSLSRNQYRVELRSEAGISLAGDSCPEAIRQRLFTAVVQKRLIEHLDGTNEGRFPLAMFSSWEAYSPPKKACRNATVAFLPLGEVDESDTALTASGEVLDVGKDAATPQDARAIDSSLMEDLVGSYREVFGEEPPHPKLETESRRLGKEAFAEGNKQLVFVRRLKSVDDLYLRLNQDYDSWLAGYLKSEGMPGCPDELLAARRTAARSEGGSFPANTAAQAEILTPMPGSDGEEELPARGDSLFSWFFRGKLDKAGQTFIAAQGLPEPSQLRERLRDPKRLESIIGEMDWRGFTPSRHPNLANISFHDLADRASILPGPDHHLGRYRRLQLAWAQLQAEYLPAPEARTFKLLQDHQKDLLNAPTQSPDTIDASTAEMLLNQPTIPLALYRRGLGEALLPGWSRAWHALLDFSSTADSGNQDTNERKPNLHLRDLDLQREVLFALLRLDHPFIDLYLGWLGARREDAQASAHALVNRIVTVCGRDQGKSRFGTASILESLAEAWEQIAKTNFAEFLNGVDRVERSQWRKNIQQQLTPFAPVEWASGQNTDARSAIARRFRMPGYPMVLIATSVLQEGEDLHVCCNRVTHFGISGSPIGIEQKNGRVDRIGSLAQRRLLGGQTVKEAGIQVSFPHLSESLEWYQIRDLSQSINDYLRSMHEVGKHASQDELTLARTMADGNPIPALLPNQLQSPFEPEPGDCANCVQESDVKERVAEANHIIEHANGLLAEVASETGFIPDLGRPNCFKHDKSGARLSLQPAHMTGELTIHASRTLNENEVPNWLHVEKLDHVQATMEEIRDLVADPRRKHALVEGENGLELQLHAACFAKGEAELDRSEILDLLTRIDIHHNYEPSPAMPDALLRLLTNIMADGSTEFEWKPCKNPALQTVRSRGQKITLVLWKTWVVASRIVELEPAPDPSNLLQRTLLRNAGRSGPDFFYSRKGEIKARIIHPVADLGASELTCILRELVAAPTAG